ncbi:MAG: hypothetical protein PHR06_02785 [Candidatus Cloacimonetes bacterium]|nr:hypothetical protein [Candidatus Cloacimonadota bacterium]
MSRLLTTFFLIFFTLTLFGYEPVQSSFKYDYLYNFYKEWTENREISIEAPALLSSNEIIMEFLDKDKQVVTLKLHMENGKIKRITESSNYAESVADDSEINKLGQEFVFVLNTGNSQYLESFVNLLGADCDFDNFSDYLSAKKNIYDSRFFIFRFDYQMSQSNIIFKFYNGYAEIIKIIVPVTDDLEKLRGKLQLPIDFGELKTIIADIDKKTLDAKKRRSEEFRNSLKYELKRSYNEIFKITEDVDERIFTGNEQIFKYPVYRYIMENIERKSNRVLLNNEIENPVNFLSEEFPYHEIKQNGKIFYLEGGSYSDFLSANFALEIEERKDYINFHAPFVESFSYDNLSFIGGDSVGLIGLSREDVEKIVLPISHILVMHRTLGSKLTNFFLLPDVVPTILLFDFAERDLIEMSSYYDLLMLLNTYWENHTIYFSIPQIYKKNNYIEFKGSLFAKSNDNNNSNYAEIRFHLNKNYILDLVMVTFKDVNSIPKEDS